MNSFVRCGQLLFFYRIALAVATLWFLLHSNITTRTVSLELTVITIASMGNLFVFWLMEVITGGLTCRFYTIIMGPIANGHRDNRFYCPLSDSVQIICRVLEIPAFGENATLGCHSQGRYVEGSVHLVQSMLTVVRRYNVLCYHVLIESDECHILPCKHRRCTSSAGYI